MGKPDGLDWVVQILIALVAMFSLANGLFMLLGPIEWYELVPTVRFTGPPNEHFIRDIAVAYLSCGVVLGYAAAYPAGRWLAALAGALWLSAHGGLHVYEVATGICSPGRFWADAPGVLGPPLLVWAAVGILLVRQRIAPAGLPRRLLLGAIDRMSPGESACFHEIAAAPGHAFEKLQHFMPITMHRHSAPTDLFHFARIGATLVEDCGPCALTAAQGALADGVPRDLVNAALVGAPPTSELRTAFDFGQAIANHDANAMDLGEQIEAVHGRATRLELAVTAATVRAYPAMKRGLGLGQSCALTQLKV
jgi:hypothetical protein